MRSLRNLVVVLGDQLDARAAAFDSFFAETDAVWMVEVEQESTHVCSCKQRIAVFLSAMRHFRDTLRDTGSGSGYRVHYTELDACTSIGSRQDLLRTDLETLHPEKVVATQPGEWRVMVTICNACVKRPEHPPDRVTQEVLSLVRDRFSGHSGSLVYFSWPFTRAAALDDMQRNECSAGITPVLLERPDGS